jgi:hypothetical protein
VPGAVPVGRFHAWWRGDPLPLLPRPEGLSIEPTEDMQSLHDLSGTAAGELRTRPREGHQPWLARIAGEPVAWGWCATRNFTIGELDLSCALPTGNRYLWDFVTLPPWRGRNIYPSLLQAIIASEPDAARFWLGHDMPNVASARGIAKAGFQEVGVLYRKSAGGFALIPAGPRDRAEAAAALFGVSLYGRVPKDDGAAWRTSSDEVRARAGR